MTRKEQADYILYEGGLLEELSKYGRPHIIGSYRMDMMAWNDLDIDVENEGMSLARLYELTRFVMERFHPIWYEAKEEVSAGDPPCAADAGDSASCGVRRPEEDASGPHGAHTGKRVWFHGFETILEDELWNVDLWFFDRETIARALDYCDGIRRQVDAQPGLRERIIRLKQELIARGLYSFEKYTSMDVYDAVLNRQLSDVEEFLREAGEEQTSGMAQTASGGAASEAEEETAGPDRIRF